jgi:hypothetical protein
MRRLLAIMLLIIVLVVLVTAPLIIFGGTRFASFGDQEKGITDFLLVSLELIGLVVSIAIVVFLLYQYIRYRRPHRLVFEAFSNESKLVDSENKPLNLSVLAQEELERQFKFIYNELQGYPDKQSQDFEELVADELHIEEDLSGKDLGTYVSIDQINNIGMIEDLKAVIQTLTDPEDINLMNLVGEIAPKEVTPVMKFIEAIFPPHIIRATGHLQWWTDIPGRVGITFEFVDLGSRRNLMIRTLSWEPLEKKEDSKEKQPSAKSNMADETLKNKATDQYIELLKPAMHWLSLMFLEQKLISQVPPINRILKDHEKRRQAQIFYILGALYYAHADQFQAYKSFFRRLGVEHFEQSSIADSNWYSPYLYLADLYSFKMQETTKEKRENLLRKALSLYDEALHRVTERETRARIRIDKALAELVSAVETMNEDRRDRAIKEVEEMKREIDPSDYDPNRADCAAFLYNLAIWYEIAYDKFVDVPNVVPRDEARRYLAYSLARSRSLWDMVENDEIFKSMREERDLEILKKELDKKLCEERKLAMMTGDNFKTEIGLILAKVDQTLGRLGR